MRDGIKYSICAGIILITTLVMCRGGCSGVEGKVDDTEQTQEQKQEEKLDERDIRNLPKGYIEYVIYGRQ